MNDDNGLVTIGDLAGSLAVDQQLVSIDVTPHEAAVLAAHQRESALKGIHEAGHAVVAAVLGVRIKTVDVSIRHAGETTLGWADETEVAFITATRMNDLVAINLAGMEAERRFLGELTNGSSGDCSTLPIGVSKSSPRGWTLARRVRHIVPSADT